MTSDQLQQTKMAASGTEEGGYECDFVTTPDHSLHCAICLSVARDPKQHGKCGQLYCSACLEKHNQRSTICPYCKADKPDYLEDNRSHRQIQSLIVRCPSKQDGCTWQGELRYQHEHTDGKCDYRPVKCPQECGMTMQWITLDHHMKEECINRPIQCLDCGEEGPCGYITTDHREECLYNLQKCPAPDCDVEICSSLLTFHMETDCEYSLVECKYRDAGCTAILPRSHMEEHENNDRYHLKVLTDSHHSLRKKYEQLLTTCDELKESVTSLISKSVKTSLPFITFKIKEYSAMEPITFYATPETYIFQVALKHTLGYLHMGIKVINGNNDHNLEWPFSGMVEVQLLNPLKDKDHFTGHIDMTPDPLRYSYANFHIPPKYVYNGHIYIRLTVISDLCKHWLK